PLFSLEFSSRQITLVNPRSKLVAVEVLAKKSFCILPLRSHHTNSYPILKADYFHLTYIPRYFFDDFIGTCFHSEHRGNKHPLWDTALCIERALAADIHTKHERSIV